MRRASVSGAHWVYAVREHARGMRGMAEITEIERHIGARLLLARRSRGVSRESLAQKLGLSPQQVADYEHGLDALTAVRLRHVARALQLDVSFFFEGLEATTPCPFAMSDERYAALRRTVQRIAADHEITAGGCRKKLSLRTATEIARDVCDELGWSDEGPDIQ